MSDLLSTRQSLQNTLSMAYTLFSNLSLDETLADEVQGHINRMLEIVKYKSEGATIPEIKTEVDPSRKERKRKEKEEKDKADKDKKDKESK